ncbi:diguanylate cyclase domain-containing protein [Rhizobium sp.]|uniref:sensor domain-containing diguanylate cyclase n=1 Tax=Rhizobium sp. TaxID=391 RepID=UPI000DBFCA07
MTTRFTHLKLVGPALILTAIVITGLAAIPSFGVARLDAESRQRQETLVKRNIAVWTSDLEFALTAWTIWDESIAKLDNTFDFEWADRNIGQSLIGTSRTRFAAVLNHDDTLIYSRTADEMKDRAFFVRGPEVIVDDARTLVDRVRSEEAKPRPEGIPNPIAFSRVEVVNNDAVLLTASLFQSDFKTSMPRGSRAPILISAVPIAGSLPEFMGNRFVLDDASVGPLKTVGADRARVEIATRPDGETEVLSWRSPTPARDLLRQSLPLAVVVTVVLVFGGLFSLRLSRRAISSILESEKQMRHAATHDFLTGLANRSLLAPEFARLSSARPMTVVCIDLDGFKSVNDRHGHAAGDELLQQVAARLQGGCKEDDIVFRLGGDEFAVLMPHISLADAEWHCRRLSSILSQPYPLSAGKVVIGASFGIAEVTNGGGESCEVALRRADQALYQAKGTGRGNVVSATANDLALAVG